MKKQFVSCIIVLLITVAPIAFGQAREQTPAPPTAQQLAAQAVEDVIGESRVMADKLAAVKIQARAFGLLWKRNRQDARRRFRQLWREVGAQTDKNFNREAARTEILKNLFPLDANLAHSLLSEVANQSKPEDASLQEQLTGDAPTLQRYNELAANLLETDARRAAALLEKSLATSVSVHAADAASQEASARFATQSRS